MIYDRTSPDCGEVNRDTTADFERHHFTFFMSSIPEKAKKDSALFLGMLQIEIAEMLDFPTGLAQYWALRGYYGTLNHNVKATYVEYLGWFDGNPATLHVL